MRTTIKVSDLDLSQWDWIQTQLRREYQFQTYTARVCVTFELSEDIAPTHVEMPVREFMLFIEELATKRKQDIPTFPYDAQEGHDHERPVKLTPSTWPECPPIRTYADGCQGYGPYDEPEAVSEQEVSRPVLPTAEQVRHLSAQDAVALARRMNENRS